MRFKVYLFICVSLLLLAGAGCRSDTAPQSNTLPPSTIASNTSTPQAIAPENNPAQPTNGQVTASSTNGAAESKRVDSCSLLTKEDVQKVQGFEVKDTKGSHQSDGAFAVAQCYYLTAEPS